MDTIEIVNHARARFEHEAARRVLREKYQAKMLFGYAGGLWRAGPDLLSLCAVCVSDDAVLLDEYENPIKVNIQELTALAQERWQEQMNAWLIEYQAASQQR